MAKVDTKAATTNPNMVTMERAISTNRSRMGQKVLLLRPVQPKDSPQSRHGDRPSQACQHCLRLHLRLHRIRTLRLFRH